MNRFQACKARSQLVRNIRQFFDSKEYLEVDTPLISPTLIPEPTIQNFSTRFINEFVGETECFMIPSPELFMKPLIAEGSGSIYQICHCFRNSEQLGSNHNPEFTMLEYYTVGADEQDSIPLTEELLKVTGGKDAPKEVLPPFVKMTVAEAMWEYAHVDLDRCQRQSELKEECRRLNLMVPDAPEPWQDTFNRIFLTLVEPNLPTDRPMLLDRYPQQINCLAERDGNYRRRWELYIRGIEVANCYKEECDKQKVRDYYSQEYAKLVTERADTGMPIPDIDLSFCEIFDHFPPTSGVAMGIDRLLMVQHGETEIGNLILFPFSDMISQNSTRN